MHPHGAYLEGQGDLLVSGLVTGIGGGYYIDCTGLLTYYQVPLTLQVSRRFRDVSGILARVHRGKGVGQAKLWRMEVDRSLWTVTRSLNP